jgi:hypothetical protein
VGAKLETAGSTRNGKLLDSVPLGVTTWTVPVVAPAGTVVVISEAEAVKTTAVPLNVTLLAWARLLPRILTAAPTLPEAVCVSTNGPRPREKLKTVPLSLAPPEYVVP